jgi:hypothetical protein
MRTFSPLAGILGILPPGADWVLGWVRGRDGGWRKRDLSETQALTARLQVELMTGSASLWERRCQEFEVYWTSDAARAHVRKREEGVRDRAFRKLLKKAQRSAPPPKVEKRDLTETQILAARLQVELATGSASLWERRCQEAEVCWAAHRRDEGMRDRALKKALKEAKKALKKAPPPPLRTSPYPLRLRKDIVYTYPQFRGETGSMANFAAAEIGPHEILDKARSEPTPFRWD